MKETIKTTESVTESGRRVLEITMGDVTLQLRFTVGAQMRLKKKFKSEPLDIIMSAAQDAEKFIAIMNEALTWEGNTNNEKIGGEQFYDLLVDNGVLGIDALAGILFSVASVSGMFSKKQLESLKGGFSQVFDEMFAQFGKSETIEKLIKANEAEDTATFQQGADETADN